MRRAADVQLPVAEPGHEHRAAVEAVAVVGVGVEVGGVVGEHAHLHDHVLAGVLAAQPDAPLEPERAVECRSLHERREHVAGELLEPPERLVLTDRERQLPRGLVGQIDVGQLDRGIGEVGFEAIAETARDRALEADVGAAELGADAEAVAGDPIRSIDQRAVDLQPPARLERPAALGGDFRRALESDGRAGGRRRRWGGSRRGLAGLLARLQLGDLCGQPGDLRLHRGELLLHGGQVDRLRQGRGGRQGGTSEKKRKKWSHQVCFRWLLQGEL